MVWKNSFQKSFGFFVLFLFLSVSAQGAVSDLYKKSVDENSRAQIVQSYGKVPLQFEINQGQTDEQVKFLSRGSGYGLFLTPTETVLSLSKDDQSIAIRMGLVGANPKPKMTGEEKLPGKTNYFIGNDPKKWRTNISTYQKVRYEEVYPGIDGNQRKLEYDFIVKPGVDPKIIRMQFAGVERMSVEAGDLILHTDSGDVVQKAPIIYQEIDGKRITVVGNYMFLADKQVGFNLGEYDTDHPLVIDPILVYATYLGGGSEEVLRGITADAQGYAYVVGQTKSNDFPTTPGSYQPSDSSPSTTHRQTFVAKLNPSGTALEFSTFFGGDGNNNGGYGVAIDEMKNVYIVGVLFRSLLEYAILNSRR